MDLGQPLQRRNRRPRPVFIDDAEIIFKRKVSIYILRPLGWKMVYNKRFNRLGQWLIGKAYGWFPGAGITSKERKAVRAELERRAKLNG